MWTRRGFTLGLGMLLMFSVGCRTTYYAAWEKFGKHKRDLLRDNVKKAKEEQQAASEQFKDALTRLKELYRFEGGDLEKVYNKLKGDFDASSSRAAAVKERIGKVEQVANDLFSEWEQEIKSMSNQRLAQSSRDKLQDTKSRFENLQSAMRRAERSMGPVLDQFKNQVLYLKHNLNAQAVASLKGEALDIEKEIQRLIQDMNASIAEADQFINSMAGT